MIAAGGWRGALVIRDPRDVVVSGAHYHARSNEPWLHRPRDAFGGRTYQEALLALPDMEARLVFELRQTGGRTIAEMLAARERYPGFAMVRFEDLVTDHELKAFRALFAHLGFPEAAMDRLLAVAERNSVFSGRVKPSLHVRSARPAQWRSEFTPAVLQAVMQRFPDAPERLGYRPSAPALLVGGGEGPDAVPPGGAARGAPASAGHGLDVRR